MSFFVFIFAGMENFSLKRILKWVKIIFFIYLLGGIALYFLQDRILFHPVSFTKYHNYNFPERHEDINLPVSEKANLNIVRFFSTDSNIKGIVLYFHGNKKNIAWYAKYPPFFTRLGYEVWLMDYPGFGKSTGKFNEEILYQWADYMYRFATKEFSADSIIIYGKSMGTGIAAQLASKQKCKRLILETPYYDYPSVVKHYLPFYPVDRMIHYKLPTYRYLMHTKTPITIFQGTDDRLVTYSNAKRLVPFLKPGDEFITISGGSHNNLFTFRETIQKLDSLLKN